MNKTNLTWWAVSLVWTNIYLYPIIARKYKILGSHSASAKKLKQDGHEKLFYFYIIGMVVPWAFIGYDLFSVIAASLLLIIGVVTGYNDSIKNDKVEDGIHVGSVMVSMAIGCIWCIYMNRAYSFLVAVVLVVTFILWKKKTRHHTWWIEELFRYMIYYVMFMEKVLQ